MSERVCAGKDEWPERERHCRRNTIQTGTSDFSPFAKWEGSECTVKTEMNMLSKMNEKNIFGVEGFFPLSFF